MKHKNNRPNHKKSRDSGAPEWEWHLRTLQGLRERLLIDRDSQREETAEPLIQDINDQADCATDEFDHDLAFSLLSQQESALQEVEAAIQRIRDRKYGVCEETGQAISAARLRAVPWARYCKDVQERLESEGLVKQTRLAPASDVHGPLTRAEPAEKEQVETTDED